jgi:hypothetical protein
VNVPGLDIVTLNGKGLKFTPSSPFSGKNTLFMIRFMIMYIFENLIYEDNKQENISEISYKSICVSEGIFESLIISCFALMGSERGFLWLNLKTPSY